MPASPRYAYIFKRDTIGLCGILTLTPNDSITECSQTLAALNLIQSSKVCPA